MEKKSKIRKKRASIWDLYEKDITQLSTTKISLAAIYKLIVFKMELTQKPTYDGFYRWVQRQKNIGENEY